MLIFGRNQQYCKAVIFQLKIIIKKQKIAIRDYVLIHRSACNPSKCRGEIVFLCPISVVNLLLEKTFTEHVKVVVTMLGEEKALYSIFFPNTWGRHCAILSRNCKLLII